MPPEPVVTTSVTEMECCKAPLVAVLFRGKAPGGVRAEVFTVSVEACAAMSVMTTEGGLNLAKVLAAALSRSLSAYLERRGYTV